MTAEGKLKAKIAAFLTERGIFFYRAKQGPGSTVGVPDFIGAYKGLMFAIEVKRPGRYENPWDGCKRDSPTQYKFLLDLRAAGGVPICADSLDYVKEWFYAAGAAS